MQKDNNTDKDQGLGHDLDEQGGNNQHDDDSAVDSEESGGGVLAFIRDKIGFGYLIFGIFIVVIVFLGARNKIMGYFAATTATKEIQAAKLNAHSGAEPIVTPEADKAVAKNDTSSLNSQDNAPDAADLAAGSATAQGSALAAAVQSGPAMAPQALHAAMKDFIENNPEVLVSSLTKFQQKMNEQRAQGAKEYISKSADKFAADKPFLGNKNGRIVITEFFDYRCGFCKRVYPDLIKLMTENSEVKIALVELPFAGEASAQAVKFSLAVYALYPEKFYDFHTALLNGSSIDDKFIFGLISQYGMDRAKLVERANSGQIAALIDANRQLAESVGVQGVPSFVINGEFIAGALSYNELKKKVDAIKLPAVAAQAAAAAAPAAPIPTTAAPVNSAPAPTTAAPMAAQVAPAAAAPTVAASS